MNKAIWFLAPLLLLFSQGCVTYPVVGSFDAYNETFKGTVTVSLFTGTSEINIVGVDGKIRGKGSSWMTYMSPSLNCEGTKGDVLLTFDDGRIVNADFSCLSCASGWGSGKDQGGNIFRFTFGMTNEEAEQFIEKTRNAAANRPSLPAAYKPEEIAKSDIPPKASEPPVEFEYDPETKTGYISVKGKGPEVRPWMLKQIEEICASKNIVIQEGATSEPARFRVLSETFLDGKFTIKFELVR
ncbi:MAG: hypothetical protein ABSG99_05685 [Sedimentisphaerales bacterium]